MGVDPPDDPGGGKIFKVPHVGLNVTITDDSASMDTDGSQTINVNDRKRLKSFKKICKSCNKKRRKGNKREKEGDVSNCNCSDTDEISKKIASDVISEHVVITNNSDLHSSNQSNANLSMDSSPTNVPQPQTVRMYDSVDHGPFTVHISKIVSSPDENINFHPIQFGNFLKKNNFKNIVNGSLKKIGRNRLSMAFTNYSDANNFVLNPCLTTNKFKAFIPSFNITRMGVVRGVPSDWSDEEVLENMSVPIGCGKILKVRRMKIKSVVNGNTIFKETETVVLTFDGQILPKRIFMCYTALQVQLYTYPTIQCYNCCRFGHTKIQCRSKPRCYKCGQGHTGGTCNIEDDSATCCLCSGFHFATSKSCPEFARQKNIKMSMAQNSISYPEASKLHPPVTRSYADALISSQFNSTSENQAKSIISVASPSKSYRKTVFLKPRTPPRQTGGYDKEAHNSLTKDYDMTTSTSNGTVLKSISECNSEPSIQDVITAIIEFLSKSNLLPTLNKFVPSNAASKVIENVLSNSIDNGPSSHTMELQKYN